MTIYEIRVNGAHAATVHVRDDIEILAIVAGIRRMWDEPIAEIDGQKFFADPDDGGVEITSRIVRS